MGIRLADTTASRNNVDNLLANMDALIARGSKALVLSPTDTGVAIEARFDELAARKIPVITVDTHPETAPVHMVVRANNRAFGRKACEFLGEKLGGKGKVVELQGAQSSINGRAPRRSRSA